jgi:hypothetical protein
LNHAFFWRLENPDLATEIISAWRWLGKYFQKTDLN